ncbi:DUF1571 domain-containing protein [Reichenbachiella sp. MALMAid0571]|uniref:LysM peptidoglycan-binding domain-containing protein n=1 Tax=Reichenbachiella sp. MALMAid0571 TaxID=3143939 RepID=UPI0032DEA1F5
MKKRNRIYLVVAILVLTSFAKKADEESGHSITLKMLKKTSGISSLIYTLSKEERIEGKMIKQISFTKMEKEPFRVYMKQLYPQEGMEVLFVEGEHNNKAIINPNGFPWVNIKLHPKEGIMRNDQHHTIYQSGFDHVVSILDYLVKKYESDMDTMVKYNGIVQHDNKDCHSVSFTNPNFKYIDYTVQENETLETIAAKFKLSEHMILEKNHKVKHYDDVSVGQVIQIPNDYSPKMMLYIDKDALIPLRMDVYDDQGLYEKYQYSKVTIDPKLDPSEFSQDYSAYGF